MVFRRIYWVVEKLNGDQAEVVGVFTSISDLVDTYLAESHGPCRFTLVKLDAANGVLGRWQSPNFDGMREALNEYIQTGEFAIDECDRLAEALKVAV